MIKTMLIQSFIGLAILIVITLENLILCKKKTIPVLLCDQIFVSLIVIKFFGWITIVYSVLLLAFLLFIKYQNHIDEESADFDYSGRIFSISAVFNMLQRPKKLVMGRILPVNHKEIKHNMKLIELDDVILSGATLITGSTGSGKSTTMKTILKQRIDERKPVVFFDYKGEEDILDDIKSYAQNAGIRYYEFSARKCTFTYDPFVNLNETGKVEALMNTRRWSTDGADEHYKTSMQLAIQNLVRAYDNYRFEQNETKNYIVGLYEYAKSYKPQSNEMDGFKNLIKSLEIIISSKAQELFGDDPDFTFEEDYPYVVCFSFTSANKALANSLSSFVYTDLMDRGTRNHYPNKLLLCVDEFGTLESSTLIKDLLEKGRSGGVQTVFSILDVNQISMNAGEHFVQAILGTINNYIIHAGATQKTAELLAGVQKFDKSYDIMSLRKPYKGRKPTALFISKYSLISKRGNQEVFRMIPYTKVLKIREKENYLITDKQPPKSNYTEEIVDNYIKPIEEIDLSMPIDNIDDYL
jgi:hypothetical protein